MDKNGQPFFFINKIIVLIFIVLLQGCASSALSRHAGNEFNSSYQGIKDSFSGDGSIANTYQNTSQRTKGIVIGGVTGAAAGSLTSIGVFPGAAIGAIFGGALGAYIDENTTLVDRLENRNVQVIVLGDQVLIVIPSGQLFVGMTPRIDTTSYSTLNLVSDLISGYPNILVKVSAFTNDTGSERINRSLTQEQAESVAKYLWGRGVNTRLLYAQGCGGSRLVQKNSPDWERGDNYRIEITLEKLPV